MQNRSLISRLVLPLISVCALATGLSACSSDQENAAAPQMPAQPIDVATVLKANVVDWSTFTTRLETPHEVELRPRISGVIESIEFVEGSSVQTGDLLVRLDPRPFKAEVDRLEAERKAAQAALDQADIEARRARSLRAQKAISAEEADARKFQAAQRIAEVAAVDAALTAARLNLEFTDITSPITGRVSSAFIKPGNTVQAGNTVLTSVVATEKVNAFFDIDERTWNSKFADVTADTNLAVYLQLAGQTDYPYRGRLDFVDNQVDFSTGTLRVRAVFPVTDTKLRPGTFGRVRMAAEQVQEQILVPERAIGTDLKNRFVLVVDDNNVLQYRLVTLGTRVGALRVIETGLNENERIAVNGPARVGPGMPITPRDVVIGTEDLSQQHTPTRLNAETLTLASGE